MGLMNLGVRIAGASAGMRLRARGILIFLLLQFTLILSGGTAQGETVRIAYSAISGAMSPLWIAHDFGLFRR